MINKTPIEQERFNFVLSVLLKIIKNQAVKIKDQLRSWWQNTSF